MKIINPEEDRSITIYNKGLWFKATYENRITKTKRTIYIESSTIGNAAEEALKKKRFFEEFISIEKVR